MYILPLFFKNLVEYTHLGHTRSNHGLQFEQNNHEAAGILMICLATGASKQCPGDRIVFFRPDTDVLVLAIAHYDKLLKTQQYRWSRVLLKLDQYGLYLEKASALALRVFLAFTGA